MQNLVPCTTQGGNRKDWKLSIEPRPKSRSIKKKQLNGPVWSGMTQELIITWKQSFADQWMEKWCKTNAQVQVFGYTYSSEDIFPSWEFQAFVLGTFLPLWVQWKQVRRNTNPVGRSLTFLLKWGPLAPPMLLCTDGGTWYTSCSWVPWLVGTW